MTGSQTWGALRPLIVRLTILAVLAAALLVVLSTLTENANAATPQVVNSTGDGADLTGGTGACETATPGECTLRAAIETANTKGNTTISFDLATFSPGIITVDPAGASPNVPAGHLPQIEADLTIDLTNGAVVTLDGEGDLAVGLLVGSSSAGLSFKVLGNSKNFSIKGFTADLPVPPVNMTAGIFVCGGDLVGSGFLWATCANNTLGDIIIDGVDIRDSDFGVVLLGPSVNDFTVKNSTISNTTGIAPAANGIAAVGFLLLGGDSVADADALGSNEVNPAGELDALLQELADQTDAGLALANLKTLGAAAGTTAVMGDSNVTIGGPGAGNNLQGNLAGVMGGFVNDLNSTIDVDITNNSLLSGADGPGVLVATCGDIVDSTVDIAVDDNTTITGTTGTALGLGATPAGAAPSGAVYVDVDTTTCSAAAGATVNVSASNNQKINGATNGVSVNIDVAGAGKSSATVNVDSNTTIVGAAGDGVGVFSRVCCGNNNSSTVTALANIDIDGSVDGIDINSQAGSLVGNASDNASVVTINNNGHIEGDKGVTGTGRGVGVISRAGTELGIGDSNTSTVRVEGDGAHDVTAVAPGGGHAIEIFSEAGALALGTGKENKSDVTVKDHRDILTAGIGANAVDIVSRAGSLIARGDTNAATAKVTDNRKIIASGTGASNAVDIDVIAGGIVAGSTGSSTNAVVKDNGAAAADTISGTDFGVRIGSTVCCTDDSNDVSVANNQHILGGTGDAINIAGSVLVPAGVCCSANTITITDNAGDITSTLDDGIDLDVYGTSPVTGAASKTKLTVSGNNIISSGDRGIELENIPAGAGPGADFTDSVIKENTIRDNTGAGIFLDGINKTTIGPANIIEDNEGGTGIHIQEAAGEADGNTITKNSMFENGGLGIDLDDDDTVVQVAPDFVGCGPPGPGPDDPNDCIPFPNGVSSVDKLLTGAACFDCVVEVFVADAVPADQTGPGGIQHGEGKTWLSPAVTANSTGGWSFTIPCGLGGEFLTMTATGKNGSTSEFGPNFGPLPANSCDPTDTPTPNPTNTNTPTITNTPGGPTNTPVNTPTNTPVTTSIEICKDTNPETDDGTVFDFDTDIPGMRDPDLEDDECDLQTGVTPDDYEITENPPAGWELDDIDCDGLSSSRVDVDLASNTVDIDVRAGETVECKFTNIESGPDMSIAICKDTNPETNDGTHFDFEGDLGDFALEDDACDETLLLAADDYEITELETDGWNLVEIDCTGTSASNIDEDLADGSVTITLENGDDVECTFTNEQKDPTDTPVPPTNTPVPPTNTPVPPTNTPVPPTNTPTDRPANTPTNTPPPGPPPNSIGDVNKNGVVNIIDAQLILQAEANPDTFVLANPKNADVNLDGEVDSRDALLIQQFVAALIPSLPA